ncbi:hypothetical protein TNIN_436211 [Trichonephila inaurata madagascariensis]|uniref:Uncharacterized protein n=1 Tax=Trichonephila inaurata madagascariensis TaxID=2747483 RepID=A0A8X6XVJ9_9ARAC|nr:hypothetical protein TNIN_436211 [Trichonephila inaurata madagascariensis]
MYKQKLEKPIILLITKTQKGGVYWSDRCRKVIFYACREVQLFGEIKEAALPSQIVISLHLTQPQRSRFQSDTENSYKGRYGLNCESWRRQLIARDCILPSSIYIENPSYRKQFTTIS